MNIRLLTTITGILSYLIAAVAGFFLLASLLMLARSGNILGGLVAGLIPGAFLLHSIAALKLRKTLRNPGTELDAKTPTGIRLVGFIALFFSITLFISQGYTMIKNPNGYLTQLEELGQAEAFDSLPKEISPAQLLQGTGIFLVILGSLILLNVIINFSLLSWYRLKNQPPQ